MKTSEVFEYFGSVKATAEKLGIRAVQSVYDWGDEPPELRQYQIQIVTRGRLRARRPESVVGPARRPA